MRTVDAMSGLDKADVRFVRETVAAYGLRERDGDAAEYWMCPEGMIGLESMGGGKYEVISWLVFEHARKRGFGGYLLSYAIRQAIKKGAAEVYIASDVLGDYETVFGFEPAGAGTFRETEKKVYVKRLH